LEPVLEFTDAEIERAREQAASFRDDSNPLLVAFFRGARGEKGIEDDTWHELLGQIADGAHRPVRCIEILSPDIDAPLSAAHANFQTPSFRELAAFLGQLDLFICADTGPLHLAAAGGARCLGLFTQTEPAVYGCLSARSTSLTEFAQLDVPALLNKA
jgi:ADP-heptose:LPS heptosyltransferase